MTVFSSLFVASRTRDESLISLVHDLEAQLGFTSLEQRTSPQQAEGYFLAAWDGWEARIAFNDEADPRLSDYRFWLGVRGEERAALEAGLIQKAGKLAASGRACFLASADYSRTRWSGQGRLFPSA